MKFRLASKSHSIITTHRRAMQGVVDTWTQATWPHGLHQLQPMAGKSPRREVSEPHQDDSRGQTLSTVWALPPPLALPGTPGANLCSQTQKRQECWPLQPNVKCVSYYILSRVCCGNAQANGRG